MTEYRGRRNSDALVTSGDDRPLDLVSELERSSQGVYTPGPAPIHRDDVPSHVGFWKRFRRNKVAVGAVVYLLIVIVAAIFAPRVAPYDPNEQNLREVNAKPSSEHWLGQDDLGRDVLSRIIYGARISMTASLLAVTIALVISLPLALLAGYVGGGIDLVLMRIADAVQVIPALVLALVIAGVLGPSTRNVAIALGIVFAPGFIRLVRGQVLGVREETFVEASRSIGAKPLYIIRKRILHNVSSPLIVQIAISFGFALLAEASLSFLGLGVQAPDASWGTMLNRAFAQVFEAGWLLWIPGLAIAFTVLAFNLIGDGLRDALGTETRRRVSIDLDEDAPVLPASGRGGPLLEVTDLSVSFRGYKEINNVVDKVSFSVRAGETLGIVGESGSGKTVSSLALLGLLPRSGIVTGSAKFDGRQLVGMPAKKLRAVRGDDISMIFQEPMTSMDPAFTIGNQIAEAYRTHRGGSKKAAWTRAAEMLSLVGIPEPEKRVHEYPHNFSGGMRQRAMIAMSLVCNPKLVIADEPTTALDVTIQSQILELLKSLQKEFGMAMIFVTHDLGVVASVCDQVTVMYAGQVVEQGAVDDFFLRPKHPYSAGLLEAMPQSVEKGERLRVIPGTVPRPDRMPIGCRFHPRCPYAIDECVSAPPVLELIEEGRRVRCIRYDELVLEGAR